MPYCSGCNSLIDEKDRNNHRTCAVVTVTKTLPINAVCNHCVTKDAEIGRKDAEISRLRNQIKEIESKAVPKKAKRDRAAYMRSYRKGGEIGSLSIK